MLTNAAGATIRVDYVLTRQAESGQQFVEIDPTGVRVVVTEDKLSVLARHGETFDEPHAPIHPGETAAAVFDPPAENFEGQARPALNVQPEQCRINVRAKRVDVVHH